MEVLILITGVVVGVVVTRLFIAWFDRLHPKYPYAFVCARCHLKVWGTHKNGIEAVADDHMWTFHGETSDSTT